MLIQNGLVFLAEEGAFLPRDIRIQQGIITQVGENLSPACEETVDAAGRYITPGLVEAHSHIGACEEAIGWEGDDICENQPVTPQMRGIDSINPFDVAFTDALKGGVTTICTGPGSAGVVAGTFVTLENNGAKVVDQMVLQANAAMKVAFGENPRDFGRHGKDPNTRMGVAAMLRKALEDARAYQAKKAEAVKKGDYFPRDLGLEQMGLVLDRKIPLKAHAHRADDICTAIRIAQEYQVDLTLDHCTEGHLIVDYLKQFPYPALVGPSFGSRSKVELKNKDFSAVATLCNAGIQTCIITDHNVHPQESLILFAAMAVKAGLTPGDALRCVTCNPADILKLGHRKGRIAPGLDGDVVIWSHYPLDVQAEAQQVYVRGHQVR